jgi:hypothetical protein
MRIQVQVCPVDLIKTPKEILSCFVQVVSATIVREVIFQRITSHLLPEQCDVAKEEDN